MHISFFFVPNASINERLLQIWKEREEVVVVGGDGRCLNIQNLYQSVGRSVNDELLTIGSEPLRDSQLDTVVVAQQKHRAILCV